MAHLAGFNGGSAVAILKHCSRDMLVETLAEREHIDASLTCNNRNLAPDRGDEIAYMLSLLEGVKRDPRAYELVVWIVTVSRDYDGDKGELLSESYSFLAESVGEENVVSAWVHVDEPGAEWHMHFAAVPKVEAVVMTNDKDRPLVYDRDGTHKVKGKKIPHKKGDPKLDSRGFQRYERVPKIGEDGEVVKQARIASSQVWDLKQRGEDGKSAFHADLERYLCEKLHRDHVGILLNEQDAEQAQRRAYSRLDHDQFVKVTAARDAARQQAEEAAAEAEASLERLESVRRAEEAGALGAVAERVRAESSARKIETELRETGSRENSLGKEVEELRERVAAAERECAKARCDERSARRRLRDVATRVKSAMRELGHLPQRVYNSLCDGARRLADKIGLNPTLAGFAGYGRRVPLSEPSAYEQRRDQGLIMEWMDRQPRKPGELKQQPNKPRAQQQEHPNLDKDSSIAAKSAQAQAINASHTKNNGRSTGREER